jgi:uncharacterized protein
MNLFCCGHFGRHAIGKAGTVLFIALALLPLGVRSDNRLAGEKSPYLLLHKDNPVDWYPWGAEAFARAKQENKPVFVSIGYSACHWCHVMARESFEDQQIAQILNEHFVSVKVDREERPDVDRLCMAFVQATTGSGGWPLNVWMTPEGEPFLGGMYFPPDDRPGRPGFSTVLRQVAEGWKSDEVAIRAHGGKVIEALRRSAASKTPEAATGIVRSAYEALVRDYDPQGGGFGTTEKFPRVSALSFLMRLHASAPESPEGKAALDMVHRSLFRMASGGLHDHIGGGFHRYAVDRAWHVPHFEKMLSDQAQLAAAYGAAWQVTGNPLFRETAGDTLDYVLRELTHPEGGFFTAVDAESVAAHGDVTRTEGAYYVWSAGEIDEALDSDERRFFYLHYGVKPDGNVPDAVDPRGELRGKNVLMARQSVAETAEQLNMSKEAADQVLAGSKRKLLAIRERRPTPRRDEKILTGWNGLMISAYGRVGAAFNDERYIAAAAKAAHFIRSHLYDANTGTLRRSWKGEAAATIPGFAEDYSFLIQGLLDLYEASADPDALNWAIALQSKQDELFWDSKAGGYFCSAASDPLIKVRLKHDHDGSEPSANSVSALNLLRLSRMLHEEKYAQRARAVFTAFSAALNDAPASIPIMVAAWQYSQAEPRQAVIAGDPRSEAGRLLARTVLRDFHPDLVVLYSRDARFLSGEAASAVAAMQPIEGRPVLYLCENFTCREPVTSPEEARGLLARIPEDDSERKDLR